MKRSSLTVLAKTSDIASNAPSTRKVQRARQSRGALAAMLKLTLSLALCIGHGACSDAQPKAAPLNAGGIAEVTSEDGLPMTFSELDLDIWEASAKHDAAIERGDAVILEQGTLVKLGVLGGDHIQVEVLAGEHRQRTGWVPAPLNSGSVLKMVR